MGPPLISELLDAVDYQRRIRIKLSIAAYGYEFDSKSIMSDSEYDMLSRDVDCSILTGRDDLDLFFKEEFVPDSGMWIHKHPELDKVKALYNKYKRYHKL